MGGFQVVRPQTAHFWPHIIYRETYTNRHDQTHNAAAHTRTGKLYALVKVKICD